MESGPVGLQKQQDIFVLIVKPRFSLSFLFRIACSVQ